MPLECYLFPQHKGFLVTQKRTAISAGIRPGRPGPGHRGRFRARAEMSTNVGISWFIAGGSGTLGKWVQVGGLCTGLLSLSRVLGGGGGGSSAKASAAGVLRMFGALPEARGSCKTETSQSWPGACGRLRAGGGGCGDDWAHSPSMACPSRRAITVR